MISIIGWSNVAATMGTRAARHGHTVEFMSRDTARPGHSPGQRPLDAGGFDIASGAGVLG